MKLDTQLNVYPVAFAVLNLINTFDIEVNNNPPDGYEITTSAWYNGRERGISVVKYSYKDRDSLVITFGETRNSDSIFVDSWVVENQGFLNPPTVSDFPDEAYARRKSFKYDQHWDAAKYIVDLLEGK